jgi:hypothetical protein
MLTIASLLFTPFLKSAALAIAFDRFPAFPA